MNNIPLADLKAQHDFIKYEIDAAIQSVLRQCAFIGTGDNPFVQQFEESFASFTGIKYCIACANGSDALEIALRGLGIQAGDEVIVPARTWIATASAVSMVGAVPVFVDTEEGTHNIDATKIEAAITDRTKAIIVVHLYGHPADMAEIQKIAKNNNLKIIEDCAQAHGSYYGEKHVGHFSDVATFSFFPGKNLGALGDAGALMTQDRGLAEMLKRFTNHGRLNKNDHLFEGRNSRMDGIQAAVLCVKLKYLSRWVSQRQYLAGSYRKLLSGANLVLPIEKPNIRHSYHQFVIELEDRDYVRQELQAAGIAAGIHYPQALPFTDAYRNKSYVKEDYPVSWKQSQCILSLPLYPEMPLTVAEYVSEALMLILTPVTRPLPNPLFAR